MSELLKANIEDAAYFITLTTVGWVDVFTRQLYCQEMIKNLQFCQENRGLEVYAYVKPFTSDSQAATTAWFIK